MTPPKPDGPTLETYIETRLNLHTEALREHVTAFREAIDAVKATLEAAQVASDLRYQQRFDAQSDALNAAFVSQQTAMSTALVTAEKAVAAALAAQERAVTKAELASEKRFEGVNEFRETLADQQRTLMPRAEVEVIIKAMNEKLALLQNVNTAAAGERRGVTGGWGYAVGVLGLVMLVIAIVSALIAFWGKM